LAAISPWFGESFLLRFFFYTQRQMYNMNHGTLSKHLKNSQGLREDLPQSKEQEEKVAIHL
jgi:hypothetical protein